MSFTHFESGWEKQPPVGTALDNPLNLAARDLVFCATVNRGYPYDEAHTIQALDLNGAGTIEACEHGICLEAAGGTAGGATFTHIADYDGFTEFNVYALAKNRQTSTTIDQFLVGKFGGGDDPFGVHWNAGEDVQCGVSVGGTPQVDFLVDGLDDGTVGYDARLWNAIGNKWDGVTISARANDLIGPGVAQSGTMDVNASQDLVVGDSQQGASINWDGWIALLLIYKRVLSDPEWNLVRSNPWQAYEPDVIPVFQVAAAAAGIFLPASHSSSMVRV
ncbi:MAG: hypothetical protein O7D34_02240 [Ignavibacteria bacterium]|nr:hypothetical protein [Ignavibacteria bacterium]